MRAGVLALVLTVILSVAGTAFAADEGNAFFALLLPDIDESTAGSDDCALGSLTADAIRSLADTQFAIVNAGDLDGGLWQGEMSHSDVATVFANDRELAKARLSAASLKELLETLLSHVTLDAESELIDREASRFDGFPNISGFYLRYDASAAVGERVVSVTLDDGAALDLGDTETLYSLAAPEYMLAGGYGGGVADSSQLGFTLSDALFTYILRFGRELTELNWQRVTVIGANENNITGMLPIPALLIGVCVLAVAAISFRRTRRFVD